MEEELLVLLSLLVLLVENPKEDELLDVNPSELVELLDSLLISLSLDELEFEELLELSLLLDDEELSEVLLLDDEDDSEVLLLEDEDDSEVLLLEDEDSLLWLVDELEDVFSSDSLELED